MGTVIELPSRPLFRTMSFGNSNSVRFRTMIPDSPGPGNYYRDYRRPVEAPRTPTRAHRSEWLNGDMGATSNRPSQWGAVIQQKSWGGGRDGPGPAGYRQPGAFQRASARPMHAVSFDQRYAAHTANMASNYKMTRC